MAFNTVSAQRILSLILATLSVQVIHTHASVLLDRPDSANSFCPPGWYHYERFCAKRGLGASDREVAMYCDGFGGIGIKGLCIIRAHIDDPIRTIVGNENSVGLSSELSLPDDKTGSSSQDTDSLFSKRPDDPTDDIHQAHSLPNTVQEIPSSAAILKSDIFSKDVEEDRVCPVGWTLYRNMCVYKPWSMAEICHHMNATEFNGMCLKHANIGTIATLNWDKRARGKRLCCCSHIRSKGNRYGC